MKSMTLRRVLTCHWPIALLAVIILPVRLAPRARAEQVVFTIDKALSSYSLIADDDTFGTANPQPGGSLSSPVSGHFLIDFSPTSPTSIQFINGDGYISLDNTAPAGGYLPGSQPGALGGQTLGGEITYAVRNLVWDWQSDALPLTAGQFSTANLGVIVNSGDFDFTHASIGPGVFSLPFGNGTWGSGAITNFQEESPGYWTLSFSDSSVDTYDYDGGISPISGTLTNSVNFVAHAYFSADNTNTVSGGNVPQSTTVIGGSAAPGGLDVSFANVVTGGNVTAQAIPSLTGLTLAAQEALDNVTNFQVAGGSSPQLWNVEFDGEFSGAATLTFNYNPAVVSNPSNLSVLHFNEGLGEWENLGGIVDALNHTITVETTSFTPFLTVEAVPEPSSIVLASGGLIGLALLSRRRIVPKRKQR